MFGSAVIDVAIGLVFVYFVIGVVCTQINEYLVKFFGSRADELEKGIRAMLKHPHFEGRKKTIADELLDHPLIHALGDHPSYIPNRTFALALLDVCAPAQGHAKTFTDLRDQIRDLPEEMGVRKALLAILDHSENRVENVRKGVEDWFDGAMDRLTGVYRRRLMLMNLVVATVVVSIVGVDTIAIATTLWQEQAIRAAVAGTATQAGATGLEDAVNALDQFNLPLGWTFPPQTPSAWFLKFVGLGISVLAVSLGAPFWFDILKRVSNVRATGPAPKPSEEEPTPTAQPAPVTVPFRLVPERER